MECKLDCKEGYETVIKPPNPESPENQIWSQPVAYCKKSAHKKELRKDQIENMLVTLHNFGFYRKAKGITSAQGYFWYNIKTKDNETTKIIRDKDRHYDIMPIAGRSVIDDFSTMTYKFTHYPEALPLQIKTRFNKGDKSYISYFVGDPNQVNIYCQDISDYYYDKDKCISGNIVQLNRLEATKHGFDPKGDFRMMKKSNGVLSDDIWVIVDGERKKLTTSEKKASDPNSRYINKVPRSVLERLESKTPYKISWGGDEEGNVCQITKKFHWRIDASCEEEGVE